jgi:hypothetical protein
MFGDQRGRGVHPSLRGYGVTHQNCIDPPSGDTVKTGDTRIDSSVRCYQEYIIGRVSNCPILQSNMTYDDGLTPPTHASPVLLQPDTQITPVLSTKIVGVVYF